MAEAAGRKFDGDGDGAGGVGRCQIKGMDDEADRLAVLDDGACADGSPNSTRCRELRAES